jgi:hypothetical protein
MAKRKKGLLGMSPRRLKASKKMSANQSARSGYVAPKKRTGPNAESKSIAKATVKGRKAKKLSSFAKLKNAARQTALSAKGSVKAAGRKAKASVKKNTNATSRLRLKKKVGGAVKNSNVVRRLGGMKSAAKLGYGVGKAGSLKSVTTKSGAKTRANLNKKRGLATKAGTVASLYAGDAAGKAARGIKRVGKMSASHRKAISDGLKKRFGFGRKK